MNEAFPMPLLRGHGVASSGDPALECSIRHPEIPRGLRHRVARQLVGIDGVECFRVHPVSIPFLEVPPVQLGILGLPKSGKTTLFNTLTASHQATDKYSSTFQNHNGGGGGGPTSVGGG